MSRIRGPYVRFCERDEAVTPHPTRYAFWKVRECMPSETRRKAIHGGSDTASLRCRVSEGITITPFSKHIKTFEGEKK